MDSVQIRILHN